MLFRSGGIEPLEHAILSARGTAMNDIAIPYGAYWSTPFARWQGSLAHLHSLTFAAHVAKGRAARGAHRSRGVRPWVLGLRCPARLVLRPAVADGRDRRAGGGRADDEPGLRDRRAGAAVGGCRRSARGMRRPASPIAADRTSNGPHLYYPAPDAPGGTGEHENWSSTTSIAIRYAGIAMIETAENVAAKHGVDRASQDELPAAPLRQYRGCAGRRCGVPAPLHGPAVRRAGQPL